MSGLSFFRLFTPRLGWNYVCCAGAFLALAYFEIDALTFIERCEARNLYFRVMNEQISAAVVRCNKTITFTRIEPFYFTCTHVCTPYAKK